MPGTGSVAYHSHTLRAVAAYGLPGSALRLPSEPLADKPFGDLLAAAQSQKITGLLWSAVADGALPVTPDQRERVDDVHLRVLASNLLLEELLVDTLATLADAGVEARALKGTAMAHLDYPDPSHRIFGDIDVLVRGPSFDAALSALQARGHVAKFPEPRPKFNSRFGKGVCLTTSSSLEIDLHRTFTMGPFGQSLALEEVWRDAESFTVGGHTVQALSLEARLLHATYHATLGTQRPRLTPLRDIAQILLTRDIHWDRLHELMRASHGEAVVARGIRTAWRELSLADVLLATVWAEGYQETPQESHDIAVYGRGSSYALRALATVRALPTLSQKVRYLTALAFPESSYLDGRHHSQVGRLLKGVGEIRRWEGAP